MTGREQKAAESEAAIVEHNRRLMLAEAAGKLDAAADVLEMAQGDLSEVPLHMETEADQLQPSITLLRALAMALRKRIPTEGATP